MTNYEIIISTEHKYLIYLVDELQKRIFYFKKIIDNRDIKLKLLLDKNLYHFYNDTILFMSNIKKSINNLNFTNLDSSELENIGLEIDSLVNYIDFFEKNIKL